MRNKKTHFFHPTFQSEVEAKLDSKWECKWIESSWTNNCYIINKVAEEKGETRKYNIFFHPMLIQSEIVAKSESK